MAVCDFKNPNPCARLRLPLQAICDRHQVSPPVITGWEELHFEFQMCFSYRIGLPSTLEFWPERPKASSTSPRPLKVASFSKDSPPASNMNPAAT
ncbi:hypothetical protein DM860_014413 [Cuscuta australis]|uniref:Uncharacterized protein n=1 Tax=Cuscuta australis TaxID=267555 RepID=A0A328DTZ6_9ASTE|nr:hypothetical protein DM860_014413 [Cuscuta australis]